MIPAHDGREMDGTTRLLKKTQKMGQLEPLIIVGLQLQFDIKPHLLMIGSFSVHFKWLLKSFIQYGKLSTVL